MAIGPQVFIQLLADGQTGAMQARHDDVLRQIEGLGEMGKHMYPAAPDMQQAETQNLTDGELFYIIKNGIRLTGMPSWGYKPR